MMTFNTAMRQNMDGDAKKARPWTPGPWTWNDITTYNDRLGIRWMFSEILNGGDATGVVWSPNGEMTTTVEDAALITLTPEMAEAILGFDNCDDCDPDGEWCECMRPLLDVAAKLRAIGSPEAAS